MERVLGRERPGLIRAAALGIAALVLFSALAKSGIWDPYELDTADLARRIALEVFAPARTALPGAPSVLPTLTDLRMGELPFTSMALSFKIFGLHDWAGRLPLALWAFAAVAALYELLARLVHPKAALYAVVALVTMPLFFMQARTMLGDIVTMSALTLAFSGLAGAAFDDTGSWLRRAAWALVGLFGLAAGYLSRGLLLGVAVPLLGVGLGWLALVAASAAPRRIATHVAGALSLAAGLAAFGAGLALLLSTPQDAPLRRSLGFALLKAPPVESTFDLAVRQLGHALFPWSAFLPLAFGRLFRPPPASDDEARTAREVALRITVFVGIAVAYAGFTLVAPYAGNLPFSAPALVAVVCAFTLFDYERGAPPSRAFAIAAVLLAAVFYRDFVSEPEKALACFVVDKPSFPKSFEADGRMLLRFAGFSFVGLVALALWETSPEEAPRFDVRAWLRDLTQSYVDGWRRLLDVWQGNLLFGIVVLEASLVGLAAMIFVGERVEWAPVMKLSAQLVKVGLRAWWIVLFGFVSAPAVIRITLDGFRALLAATRTSRATAAAAAGLLAGVTLAFGYYPALAAQLSPKEAFEAYGRLSGKGEALGVLGVRDRAASYYGVGEVEHLFDVQRAFTWMTEGAPGTAGPKRRWVILKADELPKLNARYRQTFARNLPVLDARSSHILLASNELGDRSNENPLSKIVLEKTPAPSRLVHATFEDQIETIGWDMIDAGGAVVDAVEPATPYRLRITYRVLRRVSGTNWKAFVHVDGQKRRFNGDHAVCDGKYPMNLWQAGDVIVDEMPFELEPNFTPGSYSLYFGFFSGETRFRVTQGPEHDGRVVGGFLTVR